MSGVLCPCILAFYLFIVNTLAGSSLVLGVSSPSCYNGVCSLSLGGVAPSRCGGVVTVAACFLVPFGVMFFPAMLQPSSLSNPLSSVLSNLVTLGAAGGSAVLVLSLVFIT